MERLGVVFAKGSELSGSYDNFWSFVMDAQRPAAHQHAAQKKHHQYWLREKNGGWYGLPDERDFEQVKALVLEGWPDGLRQMEKALGSLSIAVPPVSIRRRRVRSDFGDELDIHRVYSGDFSKAFASMRRPPGSKRKAFKIVVDSIANGGRDAQEMFWQGAGAIKLGELLSQAGYTVELHSCFKAKASGTDIKLSVMTKGSGAPLDLCSAAATMALPAFFRCIGHAWIHANLATEHGSTGVNVETLDADDGDFVAHQSIDSAESAAEWIKEQIKSLGGPDADQEEGQAASGDESEDDDEEDDDD